MFFQLQASTLPTEEIGSGLLPTEMLPTPTTQDYKRRGPNSKQQGISNTENWVGMLPTPIAGDGMRHVNGNTTTIENGRFVRTSKATGTKFGATLGMAAATGMLPTPVVQYGGIAKKEEIEGMNKVKNGKRVQGLNLQDLAINKMLPTPCARDYKGDRTLTDGKNMTKKGQEMGMTLEQSARVLAQKAEETSKTSQLNPQFVEEMMGFPENWTILPFLSGEMKV